MPQPQHRSDNCSDDKDYARAYVSTHQKLSRKGPRMLELELLQRGIEPETATQAIAPASDPENQRAGAREVARRRIPSLARKEDPRKARASLYQALLRKGFDPEICQEITAETLGEMETEEMRREWDEEE